MSEQALLRRLYRVGALHQGATTDGERAAAANAMRRVARKLALVRAQDPMRLACKVHVASLGVAPARPVEEPVDLPDDAELIARLGWWGEGHWTFAELRAWAAHIVDGVVLPADPQHEGACRGEVLLQLVDPALQLSPGDVPAIQRFVSGRDWSAWFRLLELRASRRPTGTS
jgi:hypothetical protein